MSVRHFWIYLVRAEGGEPEALNYVSRAPAAPGHIRSPPRSENNFTERTYQLVHQFGVDPDWYAIYREVEAASDNGLSSWRPS